MKDFFQLREAMLGGKNYPHMELCPGAIAAFKKNFKDEDDSSKVHAAAKAVNDYLAIERRVKDKGSATEADVAAIEKGVEKAKEVIAAAGLEGHDYHQRHIDTVKDMLPVSEEVELEEKSVSQAQQKAAGAALAAKRGDISPSELVGASKQMYDSMTTKELEDFARTKHKGLPARKEGNKAQLGIPANATTAELKKIRSDETKSKATRTRAHWLANMRKGAKK